jgi:hypothetical protein
MGGWNAEAVPAMQVEAMRERANLRSIVMDTSVIEMGKSWNSWG